MPSHPPPPHLLCHTSVLECLPASLSEDALQQTPPKQMLSVGREKGRTDFLFGHSSLFSNIYCIHSISHILMANMYYYYEPGTLQSNSCSLQEIGKILRAIKKKMQ